MIRVNLLPRARESMRLGSIKIDVDVLRQMAIGVTIVATVALLGVTIDELRLHRLAAAVSEQEMNVVDHAAERERSRRLMFEVAGYQEFEREAHTFRRSGAHVALEVALIGNSIPEYVWFDEMNRAVDGYTIRGRSRSIDVLGKTIFTLGRARANQTVSLMSIDNRDGSGAPLRFIARISDRQEVAP